mgnify:CR=1 FL=1
MKGIVVKIKRNAIVAMLVDPERAVKLAVSEALTYKVAGADHTTAAQSGNWDGHSSFFSMKKNSFPAGFCRYLKKKLEAQGAKVYIMQAEVPEPLGPESPIVDNFPHNPDYDYQFDTVNRLIILKAMIAQVATGGGKSRIFRIACARIARPTLFITTRKTLMYQMAEQMGDQGRKIGILGDGVWKPEPDGINFAIVDTVVSRLQVKPVIELITKELEKIEDEVEDSILKIFKKKDLPTTAAALKMAPAPILKKLLALKESIATKIRAKYPIDEIERKAAKKFKEKSIRRQEMVDFLRKIEFLTLEEAHEASGNGFFEMLNQCRNAHYRLALTATPFMKDNEEANMRLMACTGPIGIKVTEKYLIDKGILATPYFYYHSCEKPPGLNRGSPWTKAYQMGVVGNVARNSIVVNECTRANKYALPVMILIQHTNHGKKLLAMITAAGLKVKFISGSNNQASRQSALNDLGSGVIDVLIGSTILDVGVDVPAVGVVFLAGGGKAEVATRQRIGRGLRSKKEGPNKCFIMDFTDEHNKHIKGHALLRREIITSTPGFAENISRVPFDYKKHGFTQCK